VNLSNDVCWSRLADSGHGVLATVHARRGVDAVPVVYVVVPGSLGATIVVPIDTVKPKRPGRLQRMANIEADARCVLLVDRFSDDWSQLWWVRVHADAAASPVTEAVATRLSDHFAEYRRLGAVAAVITLRPTEVSGWSASQGAVT
jgi:PPOX class probable F420-dependent enzyme